MNWVCLMSDIFLPYFKRCDHNKKNCSRTRQFHLVDVDAFDESATFIPDIGNKNDRVICMFCLEWIKQFEMSLEAPHTRDFDSDSIS